jgi:hypothetical protein
MRFLQCVHAECVLVAPRFTRTRLGLAMLALGLSLVWLGGARSFDPFTITLLAGSLASIVAAAGVAGGEHERRALTTALSHPTTPLAVAAGRWVAVVTTAGLLAIICTAAVAWNPAHALAGTIAAAAVGACALAMVTALGNGAAAGLFLFMALAGAVSPEALVALAHPGFARIAAASVIELGPALWHYRDIASGDWGAVAHAVAWTGLGVLLASAFVARRRGAWR